MIVAAELNLSLYGMGVAVGDYNNDGFPDLYVSNYQKRSKLFKNNGNSNFTDVTEREGVPANRYNFTCWWLEYNKEGWDDMYVWAEQP